MLSPVDSGAPNGRPGKLAWCALNWKVTEVASIPNVASLVTLRIHFASCRDGSLISVWRHSCLKSSRVEDRGVGTTENPQMILKLLMDPSPLF